MAASVVNLVAVVILSLTVGAGAGESSVPEETVTTAAMEEGRRQLESVTRDARSPKFGGCWTEALTELENGCSRLTDDEQARLALLFANCFLAKAGMAGHPCPRGKKVSDCVHNMGTNAFNAFTTFFTHTHNMCQFLRGQAWQEATRSTVEELASTSAHVVKTMAESAAAQDRLAQAQKKTMEYQRQIVEDGYALGNAIETSKSNIREVLSEFKASTNEQRTLIFEVFDRVSKLQNLVVSEVSWLYTVIFYGVCLVVVYLVTATRRTSDARLWLYFLLSVNFILERFVCDSSLPDADVTSDKLPETIYFRMWLCRKLTLTACFLVTGYFAYTFVDYDKVNNKLLEDIYRQNADLKHKMEMVQLTSKSHKEDPPRNRLDLIDGMKDVMVVSDSGVVADDDDSSSDDDTCSFNSTQTDRTWLATADQEKFPSDGSSTEDEITDTEVNFVSAINSRQSSPKRVGGQEPFYYAQEAIVNVLSSTPSSISRKQRERSATPSASVTHRYNLRARKKNVEENPVLSLESPNTFANEVSRMRKVSQRNSAKVKMAFGRISAPELEG